MMTETDDGPPEEPQSAPSAASRSQRTQRPFPASAFEEALSLAQAILEFGSGQPVRRLTLFDHLHKSPESGPSRQWITNSSKYGLIKGSYKADQLELTPDGAIAASEDDPSRERTRARIKLAVSDIPPFDQVYRRFVGNKLPARAALVDAMREVGIPDTFVNEAVDTLVVNLRFVGLLQTLSGAERLLSVDHLLEGLPVASAPQAAVDLGSRAVVSSALITHARAKLETTCFYVTPIGSPDSEWRKHSDLFLGSIVEPALEQFSLSVVRADAIDKPGMITRQVIEYLLNARLVVADLSYHNPNVFYELAIRHAARLPVVQIIRSSDSIPFDLGQVRTIQIDTSDLYSFVPKIDTYRAEISNQVRRVLEDPDSMDNPISVFYPSFKVEL
jgi:hypothetical protein